LQIAKLDSQLCFALYQASNSLNAIYRRLLEPYGLTYTQFIVLMALWEEDGVSISALAERTGLTKATMTPLLKRLEQKGLISREFLAGNERQKNVVLTKSGQDISGSSVEITEQAFCATGLTHREASEMIARCQSIVSQINGREGD